jgi:hypothetical protein
MYARGPANQPHPAPEIGLLVGIELHFAGSGLIMAAFAGRVRDGLRWLQFVSIRWAPGEPTLQEDSVSGRSLQLVQIARRHAAVDVRLAYPSCGRRRRRRRSRDERRSRAADRTE